MNFLKRLRQGKDKQNGLSAQVKNAAGGAPPTQASQYVESLGKPKKRRLFGRKK